MQALFFMDMTKDCSQEALQRFYEYFQPSQRVLPFFLKLTRGVVAVRSDIDELIERFSQNWKINRMSCVDRNVIRIAVYEMLYCGDIPAKVSINEAIDVGKKYGTEESGAFINGILDGIRIAMDNELIQIPTDSTAASRLADPSADKICQPSPGR